MKIYEARDCGDLIGYFSTIENFIKEANSKYKVKQTGDTSFNLYDKILFEKYNNYKLRYEVDLMEIEINKFL